MQRQSHIQAIAALALLIGLAGCDSNSVTESQDSVAEGRFEATVSGTEEISFEGRAVFASEKDGEGFVLALISDDRSNKIALIRWQATRPEPGRHDIVEYFAGLRHEAVNTKFFGTASAGSMSARTESGTLTITSSSAGGIAGTIEFTGRRFDQQTITVSATFNATCTPGTGQDCG